MKQFFGAFFGSIIGILIATVLTVFIVIAVIKSSLNNNLRDELSVKPNSVLKLVLEGNLRERSKDNPLSDFNGLGQIIQEQPGLNTLLKKINFAKDDNKINGIYIKINHLRAGFASLQELRDALARFRTSGKFIYVYAENYSSSDYFLASIADKIFLNPQGEIEWKGLSMNILFFKHAIEKLELDLQIFRHGKFKSAIEPFILDKMSQSNRLQSEKFLNSIWASIINGISKSRGISPEELNKMADNLELQYPEDALGKLIDVLAYEDEVLNDLKKLTGQVEKDKLRFVDFDKYEAGQKLDLKINSTRIAVVYANGVISGGEQDDEQVGSERLARTIREARLDDKVKAIVLRVNSPGGSALASDVIWREVKLARLTKPTVVSMGNLAASGGYYISCPAERIFAEPNTITGSIGVFGVLPSFGRMLDKKLGISSDTVNTNKHSDMGSLLRTLDAKESDYLQNNIERIYKVFLERVAEGRKMSSAEVDSIGQGRVWSGTDALKLNLVDEIGGLNEAILYAAKKAGLKEYKLIELPKQKSIFEEFFGNTENKIEQVIAKKEVGFIYEHYQQVRSVISSKGVQARLPFEIIIK